MFDIGWSEMAVIALLALLVIGPKELPNLMRNVARWVKKARSLTREFQSGIDEMVREADLEDARKAMKQTSASSIGGKITDAIDPTGSVSESLNEIQRDTEKTADIGAMEPLAGDDGEDGSEPAIAVTPAQVAPAHSLSPPPEAAGATSAVAEAAPEEPEPVSSEEPPKTAGKTG